MGYNLEGAIRKLENSRNMFISKMLQSQRMREENAGAIRAAFDDASHHMRTAYAQGYVLATITEDGEGNVRVVMEALADPHTEFDITHAIRMIESAYNRASNVIDPDAAY